MKILFQHRHAPGEISGVLTSLDELLPALQCEPGIGTRLLSTTQASLREQVAAVWWADAVVLNSNALWVALVARLTGRRTLLKLHHVSYQTVHHVFVQMSFRQRLHTELRFLAGLDATLRYRMESMLRLALRTVVALGVDRVCACSQFCADQSALPRPVAIHPNPVQVPPDVPPRSVAHLDSPPRFVFVGRVTRDKGWPVLVDAAARLAGEGRAFRVDVVGEGPELAVLKTHVRELELVPHFTFRGRLPPAEVRGAFRGALAAVMPSQSQEAAGYIPLEAATQRVASLVSRVGGLPETAGPDCPDFAAGDGPALARLMAAWLDAPEQAVAAGNRAYDRAARDYSPRRAATALLALLSG